MNTFSPITTREDAEKIVGNHTRQNNLRRYSTSDLIYWAIKIRDGIAAARKWKRTS